MGETFLDLYNYGSEYEQLDQLIRKYAVIEESMISINMWDGLQYFTWVTRDKGDLDFQDLELPSDIYPAQIQNSYIFNNTRYALVLQPNMNIYLENLPREARITFSGVLVAKPGDNAWVKAWQIIDHNGAGSGEGNLTLLRLRENMAEKIGCYYFGENIGSGNFELAKNLGKPQDTENCSHWMLKKVDP